MKIAIDFDGVICERYGIPRKNDFMECPPTENCIEAIHWLKKQGHDPYVLTQRDSKQVEKWFKANNFPKLAISNIKLPETKIIIDDRAIRFTDWQDICKYFG